jgi:hypothetical protein
MELLKQVLSKENMHLAYKAVRKDKGPAGVWNETGYATFVFGQTLG